MSRKQSIRVPMEYESLLQKIRMAPVGYRVDIVPRITAMALSRRLSPVGAFYGNRKLDESIFIKEIDFDVKKLNRYLLIEV